MVSTIPDDLTGSFSTVGSSKELSALPNRLSANDKFAGGVIPFNVSAASFFASSI